MFAVETDLLQEKDIDIFLEYISQSRNVDLTFYRKTFLTRRLGIRLNATKCTTVDEYIALLKENPSEWDAFLDRLSVNVSKFFRDPEVYSEFRKLVIPQLIMFKKENSALSLRCWSCGCSNGEEPYSLSILFTEALKEWNEKLSLRITASDVDSDALATAQKGEYASSSLNEVSSYLLDLYFEKISLDRYRVKNEIRNHVAFKKHNLFTDRPFPFMDVVFFRNVGIYLSKDNAEKVFESLYKSLRKDGYLVLGKVETLRKSFRDRFQPVSLGSKIYKKL